MYNYMNQNKVELACVLDVCSQWVTPSYMVYSSRVL